jgi:hypothetical protein
MKQHSNYYTGIQWGILWIVHVIQSDISSALIVHRRMQYGSKGWYIDVYWFNRYLILIDRDTAGILSSVVMLPKLLESTKKLFTLKMEAAMPSKMSVS